MPPPQIPDGKFSSGLGVAILALLPCCGINLLAIIAIVLSAIASGEFKKGDIAKAQKHAKLSKTFSTLAFIIGIIFWIMLISSIKTTLDEENNQDQQTIIEEIEENQ